MLDTIQKWFNSNSVLAYEIKSGSSLIYKSGLFSDTNEAFQAFENDVDTLSAGRYSVKGKKRENDNTATTFPFAVDSNETPKNKNEVSEEVIKMRVAEGIAAARKEWEFELLDKRLSEIERKLPIIIKAVQDLSDGDEENNDEAKKMLDKVADSAEALSAAKDLFSGINMKF
jgi:hypothetical protein